MNLAFHLFLLFVGILATLVGITEVALIVNYSDLPLHALYMYTTYGVLAVGASIWFSYRMFKYSRQFYFGKRYLVTHTFRRHTGKLTGVDDRSAMPVTARNETEAKRRASARYGPRDLALVTGVHVKPLGTFDPTV